MAMILEVRDARGASFHRLADDPLTVGRAVSNDIILDDPYADAVHARIYRDASGALVVADADSINGIRLGDTRVDGALAITGGMEIRVGRTLLRFRATDETLAPALVDDFAPRPSASVPAAAIVTPRRWDLLGRLLASPRAQAWVIALMTGASALQIWLADSSSSTGTTVFAGVLVVLLLTLIWAAIWAAATRGPERRFQLRKHFAVAAVSVLAMVAWGKVYEWLEFLFPDSTLAPVAYSGIFVLAMAWLIAAHLAVPGVLSRRRRWRAAFNATGIALAIVVVGALLGEDDFSDVPEFGERLKYLPATMVPAIPVEDFLAGASDIRAKVDAAASAQP